MRFTTKSGEWQDILLPIHELQPTFRGRTVQASTLDPAQIMETAFGHHERLALAIQYPQ